MTGRYVRGLLFSVRCGVCLLAVAALWLGWPSPALAGDAYDQPVYACDGSVAPSAPAMVRAIDPAIRPVETPAGDVGYVYDSSSSPVATNTAPPIKPGAAGGPTAGKPFPGSVRDATLAENPGTCVYCRMETPTPQVDHAIPRVRGGNATLDNAQTTCPWCNASKGPRDFPVNPPPGYRGLWPPSWWDL